MKLRKLAIFCTVSLLILSGCGTAPKPADKPKIDTSLPVVELTQNGIFLDMNAIAFEWKNIEDMRVKGIYIYRRDMSKKQEKGSKNNNLKYYDTIKNRFATHYADTKVKPDTQYSYSFKTFSKDAESKMSKIKLINSLPVLQSVVWIKSIQNMPRTAKIIWRPHTNEKVKSYIIERKTLSENKWKKITTVKGRLNAEFIDTKLKDDFVYKYRIKVVTFDEIVSSPSDIVEVITKSLPISIKNIKATTNLPRKIKVTWDKSTTEDFNRYYLYRAEKSDGSYKLIAKLYNNIFIDSINEDAKEYFYRVSAVEKNGLESIHNKLSIQGITLMKPKTPTLLEARLIGGKIHIEWRNKDPRVKTFKVVRKTKTSWLKAITDEFHGIEGNKFIDADIGPNITYTYQVYGVDSYNIHSKPSIELEIRTPKTIMNHRKTTTNTTDKSLTKPKNSSEEIVPTQDFN